MLIGETKLTVVGGPLDGRLLLACASVRFLNVGKISIERPGHVGLDTTSRVVADRQPDRQAAEVDRMEEAQRQRPMRNAGSVHGHGVPRLSAPTPAELRQLRIDVGEGEGVWLEKRSLARPR